MKCSNCPTHFADGSGISVTYTRDSRNEHEEFCSPGCQTQYEEYNFPKNRLLYGKVTYYAHMCEWDNKIFYSLSDDDRFCSPACESGSEKSQISTEEHNCDWCPTVRNSPLKIQKTYRIITPEKYLILEQINKTFNFCSLDCQYKFEEKMKYPEVDTKGLLPSDADLTIINTDLLLNSIQLYSDTQQGSTSLLQRKLRLGYAEASHIVDFLEMLGVLGPFIGANPRVVHVNSGNIDYYNRKLYEFKS